MPSNRHADAASCTDSRTDSTRSLPALERESSLMPASFISLNYGVRLCESYEAYRAYYPRTLMRKLDVSSRTEAVIHARRQTLLG